LSTSSEEDDIQVTADRSVLSTGTYSGKIVVNSNGGNEEINVSIVVVQGPVLKINPDVLNFGQTVPTRSFFIQNDGGGTLDWTISESLPWLTVAPTNGSTGSTDAENIQVTVDRSQLNPGSYSGNIRVNSNGGNAEVTVNMTVVQGPALDVSVSELDFGSRLNSMEFSISNSGGETLEWSIVENIDWLDVEPVDGEVKTDPVDIKVTVDRTAVSPGEYDGLILVKSNGGEAEIEVNITIQASGEWLIFDDGTFEKNITTSSDYHFFLTQFDRPSDWKEFKVTRVAISFSQTSGADNIELFCFSTQLVNRRYYPYQSLFGTASIDPESGWNEWKVDWTLDIDKFCVGYRQTQEKAPNLHIDTNNPQNRSYYVKSSNQGFPDDSGNWAIRVFVVKASGAPVPGRWLDITIQPGDSSSEGKLKLNLENEKPL